MRIRSTKPEFWRSERVASVSWDARLVLKGLESFVDDNGVGKDDLALIVADVFPRDLSRNPTGTLQKVSEALHHLSDAGLLWRYEADGNRLLYVAFWEFIQRIEKPGRGRLPRPDGTMNYRDSEIREASGNPPGAVREPSGLEQGTRGPGDQGNRQAAAPPNEHDDDPNPQPEFGVPALLQSHGVTEAERPQFLAALKQAKIRNTATFVNALHRKGELKGRIQEWREDLAAESMAGKPKKRGPDVGVQEWMLRS